VREGTLVDVRVRRVDHVRMTIAHVRFGGAAGRIDTRAAVGTGEAHAAP
jgi:hypothetical protein